MSHAISIFNTFTWDDAVMKSVLKSPLLRPCLYFTIPRWHLHFAFKICLILLLFPQVLFSKFVWLICDIYDSMLYLFFKYFKQFQRQKAYIIPSHFKYANPYKNRICRGINATLLRNNIKYNLHGRSRNNIKLLN